MAIKKAEALLGESTIRQFGKLAGLSKQVTDKFVKGKLLKENDNSGRGATFDPTGTDSRFENLKESDDVTEENKDLEQEGKDLEQESKDLEQEGKHIDGSDKGLMKEEELEQEGKELEQEAKSLVGKKPTKIKGGGSDHKMKPAKTSSKNSVKEGLGGLPPPDDEMGGPDLGGDDMGGEPPLDQPPAGGGDVAGLVKAIADAISAHTGVDVSVEGAGVPEDDLGGDPSLDTAPEGDSLPPTGGDSLPGAEDEDDPLAENGIVSPKFEDRAARGPSGTVAEQKRRQAAKNSQTTKDTLVAEITSKVMKKLSEAVAKQRQIANNNKPKATLTQPKKK